MARHSPPSLKRRPAAREPRRRFTIVCEGKNTEPDYFLALKAAVRDTLVDLIVVPEAGVPMTIASRCIEHADQAYAARRKRGKNSYEENDEIWAVFDRDEHPNFDEAIGRCAAKGINVARSNPCFEIWLILHWGDFQRPDGRDAVQAYLRTLHPEYDPKKGKRLDCIRLMSRIEEAERRAERQLANRETEGKPFGPPSKTIFHLTQAIRRAADLARDKWRQSP